MILLDLLSAKITSSMLAIPLSVFVGACVGGYISETKSWLIGLLVGLVYTLISIVLYVILVDETLLNEGSLSAANVLSMPISTSIICGLLGGILSGVLKNNLPIFINNIKNV